MPARLLPYKLTYSVLVLGMVGLESSLNPARATVDQRCKYLVHTIALHFTK